MSRIIILLAIVLAMIGTACSGATAAALAKNPKCKKAKVTTRVKVGEGPVSLEIEETVEIETEDEPATSQPAEGEGEGGDQPQPIQQPGWTPLTHTMDISLEFPVLEELEGGNLLIDLENVTLTFTDPVHISEASGQADLGVPADVAAEASQDTPYLGNTRPQPKGLIYIDGPGHSAQHTVTGTMAEVLTALHDQGVVELRGHIVGLFFEYLSPTDIALLAAEGIGIELEEPVAGSGGGDDDMMIGEWDEEIGGSGPQKTAPHQCPPIGRIVYY